MEVPYVPTREKMLRVPYTEYKKFFYNCKLVDGSYDDEDKTVAIFIEAPIRSKSFNKQFEVAGTICSFRKVVGHGIKVMQYEKGRRASYKVCTFDPNHSIYSRQYDFSLNSETDIPDKGDLAKTRAILLALALADTGKYKAKECTK